MTKPRETLHAKFESTQLLEDRKASIQAENQQITEDKEIADFHSFPKEGETREQLLDRIRQLRDQKPEAVEVEVFRSEGLQKEFDAEQAAGRAAVAKAQAERDRDREAVQRIEMGEE